jgi:hypothetical protein
MPLSILFWVVYLISLIVGWWGYYEPNTPWFKRAGHGFVIWVLIGILGWQVFGPAVR